jgi:hypothetical protein
VALKTLLVAQPVDFIAQQLPAPAMQEISVQK